MEDVKTKIISLKEQGYSYEQIANQMGLTKSKVYRVGTGGTERNETLRNSETKRNETLRNSETERNETPQNGKTEQNDTLQSETKRNKELQKIETDRNNRQKFVCTLPYTDFPNCYDVLSFYDEIRFHIRSINGDTVSSSEMKNFEDNIYKFIDFCELYGKNQNSSNFQCVMQMEELLENYVLPFQRRENVRFNVPANVFNEIQEWNKVEGLEEYDEDDDE